MNNITLNKDISKIHETMILGMPLRRTILSAATVFIGITSHKIFYEYILNDNLVHILSAMVCLLPGFIAIYEYQGMTGEQIILEFVRSAFLKKTLVLSYDNENETQVREIIKLKDKEVLKNDKVAKRKEKGKK